MSTIVIACSPGTYLASLGAMSDAHARLGEAFATNPALGDYATMETRLVVMAAAGGRIELAGGRKFEADDRLANLAEARIVYLPAFQAPAPERALEAVRGCAAFHAWLRQRHKAGALIAACGASVLHLAVAGLLDGTACSAPARLHPLIEAHFPETMVDGSEPIAERDRVFTCARDADNAALVLRLIDRAFSAAIAQGLAQRERPAGVAPLPADPLVARAQSWIRDHFASDFAIADLAGQLGTSHQALIRRFRLAGEGTPRAYAQRLRVDAAAISLVETGRSVAEIAQLVGYADIPSFRRVFTRRMGMPPGEWRRRERSRSAANGR
jgi:transcriptional regulator GlxA family with amidase domain